MKIQVFTVNDEERILELDENDNVYVIKQKLFTTDGIKEKYQRLLYHGILLKNNNNIKYYNIKEGDTIHMLISIHLTI